MLADQCSLVHDYVARQKIGGTHLKYHVKKQIVALPPDRYTEAEASVTPILAAVEQIYRRSLATPIPADTYGARL